MNKLLNINELKFLKKKYKNKKIILCHGVFDLLHIGHINYFISAKKLGHKLVVSVTDDQFVNKGPGRPAFSINERVKFLNQINCIDHICISDYLTAEKIIINLKPNYYCKGIDYLGVSEKKDKNLNKELKALRSVNGKFHIIREKNYSSSKTINDYGLQNLSEECKKFIESIRNRYSLEQILNNLKSIQKKKVLTIGETIIDKYITTEAIGKSGKEPIMVIKKKNDIKFLGGIGYIANLCNSFAKETKLLSFLGQFKNEKKFILKNLYKKIKYNFLLKKGSPTILKTRYLDDYKKNKIIGIYDLNDQPISKNEESKFYNLIKENLKKYKSVIVADYGHGIITEKIRKLISKNSKKIFLNTQINSFNRGYHSIFKYKKINTLVINESELRYEIGDNSSRIIELVKLLRKKIIFNNAIVTRGNLGSVFFSCKNWLSIYCPAFNQKSIDSIGAGDTFLTLSALCLSSKVDPKLVLLFSSLAAAYSTNQLGNKLIFNYSILQKQINHILK